MKYRSKLRELGISSEPGMFSGDKLIRDTERLVPLLETRFPRAHRILRRVRGPQNHLLWEGIPTLDGLTLDPKYKRLKLAMFERLSADFAPSDRNAGVLDSVCVPQNWNSTLSVGGWPMDSMGYAAVDNTSRAIQDWVSPRHKEIAINVARDLMSEWRPTKPLRFAKTSSSGFPHNENDIGFKKELFWRNLNNITDIDSKFVSGKLDELFSEYDIVAGSSIGYRFSNDSATLERGVMTPKARTAADIDVARGVDKEVPIANREIPGEPMFFSQRTRVFHAQPASLNHMHQAVVKGFIDSFTSRYEAAYKVRSRDDFMRILKNKYVFGLDAGQFDQSYAPFVTKLFFEVMRESVESVVVDALELQMAMPIYSPSPFPNQAGFGVWLGNPLDASDFKLRVGLPSGICLVSMMNKWWGTCIALFAMDDLSKNVMGREAEVLRHEHPDYVLLNNGDDSVAGSRSKPKYAKLLAHISKNGSPYCSLEIEDAIRYGGMLLYRDIDSIKAAPDPHTYVNNWWSPERGLALGGGHFRTEPELSWVARRENFMDHPQGGEMHELIVGIVNDIYGINIDRETRTVKPPSGTEIYALIADDPGKLNWMDIEVPDFIADKYVGSLQTEEYEHLVRPLLSQSRY